MLLFVYKITPDQFGVSDHKELVAVFTPDEAKALGLTQVVIYRNSKNTSQWDEYLSVEVEEKVAFNCLPRVTK